VSSFLEAMATASAARVRSARARLPEAALADLARQAPAAPPLVRSAHGFDLIAELKLRSPASGVLGSAANALGSRVAAYARAGAAAVSVLTEPSRFDGSLEHLRAAAQALAPLGVPAMRKDFLVDPYQVLEARAAGAGGVLLILRMLSRESLTALIGCAREHGLFVLLEAFDEADLARMRAVIGEDGGQSTLLAGLNCRDLATLEVVPARLLELASQLPAGAARVAESGVENAAGAARLAAAGYDLVLVGSALMRDPEPGRLVCTLLQAGRAARQVS